MPDINWYPGHMARSRRLLMGQLRSVDAVIELCDARAPISTRNPDLNAWFGARPGAGAQQGQTLASQAATAAWLAHYRGRGWHGALQSGQDRGDPGADPAGGAPGELHGGTGSKRRCA